MFKEKWNNFWFEERSRQTLCLMRIFIGLTFLYKQIIFNNLLVKGIVVEFPQHSIKSQEDFYFDVFRNPIPGFEWLPYPTLAQYHMIEDLMFILTIFFVVGLFVRIVGPLIAITYLYFFMLSQFVYYHHIMNFAVVFLILGFSNCSDHYSLDSLIKKIKKVPRRKILPIRLFQVFISIIYFFSFIQKLKGGWLTGDIMIAFHDQGSLYGPFINMLEQLFSNHILAPFEEYCWKFFAWFTLFAEGLLIFGLWVPRLRRFSLLVGVVLHFGIDITMKVSTFSFQMYCLYMAFILPEAHKHQIFYDRKNGFHRIFKAFGRVFDWFQRIEWIDIKSTQVNGINGGKLALKKYDDGKLYGKNEIFALFPLTFIPAYILILLRRILSFSKV